LLLPFCVVIALFLVTTNQNEDTEQMGIIIYLLL